MSQHKKYDTSKVKTITLNGKKYIDMSVIEDIKAEITSKADDADKGCKISSDYYIREKLRTIAQTCDEVCKIIDKAVREVEK